MKEKSLSAKIELLYLEDLAECNVNKLNLNDYYNLYYFVDSLKSKICLLPEEEKTFLSNLNKVKFIISYSMRLRDELNIRLKKHQAMRKERELTGITKHKTPFKVKIYTEN